MDRSPSKKPKPWFGSRPTLSISPTSPLRGSGFLLEDRGPAAGVAAAAAEGESLHSLRDGAGPCG